MLSSAKDKVRKTFTTSVILLAYFSRLNSSTFIAILYVDERLIGENRRFEFLLESYRASKFYSLKLDDLKISQNYIRYLFSYFDISSF